MNRLVLCALLSAVTAVTGSCRRVPPEVTAVRIVVSYSGQVEQIRFTLRQGVTEILRSPVWRPEVKRGLLSSPQDFVVYLDDGADRDLVCGAEARRGEEIVGAGEQSVRVHDRQVALCQVNLAAVGPDGGRPGDGGGTPGDGGPGADGSVGRDGTGEGPGGGGDGPGAPRDGFPADNRPPADGQAPESPVADGPAMPDTPPPPDAPTPDAPAGGPPDVPPDMAGGPDPTVIGCSDGDREAFSDPGPFPAVAGCGAAGGATMSYAEARQFSGAVCAPGWHWCRATDVGGLPISPAPAALPNGNCTWLDSTPLSCADMIDAHTQSDCQGGPQSVTVAGPDSGGQCALPLGCTSVTWKLAVPLAAWSTSSARIQGACLNHVAPQCAGGLSATNCWIACCH
jgi:hypothetical protein